MINIQTMCIILFVIILACVLFVCIDKFTLGEENLMGRMMNNKYIRRIVRLFSFLSIFLFLLSLIILILMQMKINDNRGIVGDEIEKVFLAKTGPMSDKIGVYCVIDPYNKIISYIEEKDPSSNREYKNVNMLTNIDISNVDIVFDLSEAEVPYIETFDVIDNWLIFTLKREAKEIHLYSEKQIRTKLTRNRQRGVNSEMINIDDLTHPSLNE